MRLGNWKLNGESVIYHTLQVIITLSFGYCVKNTSHICTKRLRLWFSKDNLMTSNI